MKMRNSALFVALIAVLGGLLTALPAEAASYKVYLKGSRVVAISSTGNGKVAVKCNTGHSTCKGRIYFPDEGPGSPRVRSYSVPAGRTAYVRVAMRTSSTAINPRTKGSGLQSISGVRLRINEDRPKNITHDYRVRTETLVSRQYISGTVSSTGVLAKDVRVEMVRLLRGGNTRVLKSVSVAPNGSYKFGADLGVNNSPSEAFRLRISGTDQNNVRRSWFYRGSGGGVYLRDSQAIRADKNGTTANFRYHQVTGSTKPGAEVSIVGTPASFGGGTAARRELDIPSCGNIFGRTEADGSGNYTIGFVPATSYQRYMIGTRWKSSRVYKAFYGKALDERYGSCYDAANYRRSVTNSNLMDLRSSISRSTPLTSSGEDLRVNATFSSAYDKKKTEHDRWISIREKIPGVSILDSPIVAEQASSRNGNAVFKNVDPGDYWVEVGRRQGCSDWYGSVYPNNRLYFKGADRYAENWKSFKRVRDLSGNSSKGLESYARSADPNRATNAQNSIPRGKKGWMYRDYCKAYGTGRINSTRITYDGKPSEVVKKTSRNGRGGIVSGRVTRIGGKTNKEMLVRLSTSSGSRVIRTDITDSSGRFYIAGLSSGKYTISVNSDSWRGIGRSFSGKKSVTVKAGKSKSVGTLRFKH